jgi:hypothetical protein
MLCAIAMLLAAMSPTVGTNDESSVRILDSKSLPVFESVSIYRARDFVPGKSKPLSEAKFDKDRAKALTVPLGSEAVHIYAKPKDGIAVLIGERFTPKPGTSTELKLDSVLGVLDVFQMDGFQKVDRIVVTSPDDPGPDEEGHVPVQIGSDYRVEMSVPDGFYAVWLVPANGVRSIRIEDRVRVLPGKIVRVGN